MLSMTQGIRFTGMVAVAASVLLGGGAVFAQGIQGIALQSSGPPSPPASLTVNYVGFTQPSPGQYALEVKVSNLVVPPANAGPYSVEFDLNIVNPEVPLGIHTNFSESILAGSPSSETWSVPLEYFGQQPLSPSQVQQAVSRGDLTVIEYLGTGGPELAEGGLYPIGALPYGQLPEVPWAAGLPLLGLGIGALGVWNRRRRAQDALHLG
ncbi:MAG: hypothetical protein K6U14_07990 [Firmicutes bacterium]|nr:hypothetical protein [Alicyclobacillaceae bacterium]MCL6497555.1 hypothetical protein [Bacillota bacterium]